MKSNILLILILGLLSFVMPLEISAETPSDLASQADENFNNGNYAEAVKQYTLLYGTYNDEVAQQQMKKCNQCLKLLSEALDAERSDNLSKAIEKYQAILTINPRDPKIPELIRACESKQYASILQEAQQLYREGNYNEASEKLDTYTRLSGQTDADLLSAITVAKTWQNEAEAAFNRKDYTTAKSYYDKILAVNPTDIGSANALTEIARLTQTKIYIDKSNYKNKKQVNGTALAYSLIPGLGLIQKGHKSEGFTYLIGDIALLGAGIGLSSNANSQKKTMNNPNTGIDTYNKAKDNYNFSKNTSYICFGAATGLYIINLIRSYVAKPKSGAKLQWEITPGMSNITNGINTNPISLNFVLTYTL